MTPALHTAYERPHYDGDSITYHVRGAVNETELSLELVGQLMRRMQAEQRTLLAEVRSYRRDISRIEAAMATRDMLEAERDAFMSRLENIESEMSHGFSQILAHLRR